MNSSLFPKYLSNSPIFVQFRFFAYRNLHFLLSLFWPWCIYASCFTPTGRPCWCNQVLFWLLLSKESNTLVWRYLMGLAPAHLVKLSLSAWIFHSLHSIEQVSSPAARFTLILTSTGSQHSWPSRLKEFEWEDSHCTASEYFVCAVKWWLQDLFIYLFPDRRWQGVFAAAQG